MTPSTPHPDSHDARLEHERLLSLVNSMADGVIAVDEHVRIVLYNAAALNILDSNSSMVGKSLGEFLHPIESKRKPVDILQVVLDTKLPTVNRDYHLRYGDGSYINLFLSITPVHLGFGKQGQGGFVLLLRDITREKSLEEERDEFISVISHELRTPIAIAEGNISNAQFSADHGQDAASLRVDLEQAHNQILFLADLINDLSTLSRAERGKLTLEVEPINVHDLVTELASNYMGQAHAKQLSLDTRLHPHLELLYSSKLYVREVLQNFITNAIKYTEHGSVIIAAKPGDDGVIFEVIDTGIGISKSDQERVFDKFFRSEDYRTRKTNGTGLGLYVTIKLARLLQADIDIESELNHGSTFTIRIPNIGSA
jgi:PAS domain S-box-containing protein